MGGRHQRVRVDVIIRMAEIVRHVEDPPREEGQEHDHGETVLDGRVGREGQGVQLEVLDLDAGRVVLAADMQRPDMQHHDARDHEGQQVMQREEAVERRVVDRIATPQPGRDGIAHHRNGREEVGDDRRAPEGHLAPRQHIAHEGGRHHQQEDDHAQNPEHFARCLVGAIVEAAQHVDVDGDEEHRGAVGVGVAQEPAPVHVAHNVLDGVEGEIDMRGVMHCQHDAGDDLDDEHQRQDATEGPEIIQVLRRRIDDEGAVDEAHDRQPALEPAANGALGNVC